MYSTGKTRSKQIRGTMIVVIFVGLLILISSGNLLSPLMINDNQKTNFAQEVGQLDRVLLMPNLPEPFSMRDWEQVARDYDAFYFNLSKTGTYLPLTTIDTNNWGGTTRDVFKSPAYVGQPTGDEAINTMAAVLSATLVGINKSDQYGYNWVEMCENWFNIGTTKNMYLNNLHTHTKTSFWYVLFPNLLFYQLAYYYPDTGDFQNQIKVVADRWYDACVGMGGKLDPWTLPNFNHQAFDFSTMLPYYDAHREPEAAAAIAWLEYIAYMKYGDPKYLVAVEWCIQYLEKLKFNPLYEILLPYGAYITARMNAELGKTYDIDKITNWCFGPANSRPGWGVIAQNWGGYDAHGLHGSITDRDGYAFAMGTFENVGCFVPIVRYDDRYAHAIGKYVLNAANAARLFYGNGLDADHQDEEAWIEVYDPDYCIAYEGLRKTLNDVGPFATGDPVRNGWGPTNLGLYGSSHVGIFGGIIEPTNDEKILQLDCLVTDYYHDDAYPTYLYYNPYNITKTVEIDVGSEMKSLYDTTTESFLVTNVSGTASFQLPADTAAVVVIAPAEGVITYNGTRTLINNVTVDFEPIIEETSTTTTTNTITTTTSATQASLSNTTTPEPSIDTLTTTKSSPFLSFSMTSLLLCIVVMIFRRVKRKS